MNNHNGLKSPLILIVDDTPENLQVLGNILRDENYKIIPANSGFEALKIVNKRLPSLILLDVMMPGMDGFEVCKKLKSSPKTAGAPVIFLTAKSEIEDIVKGFQAGGVDYITKPFNKEELLARVKNHLELERAKNMIISQNQKLEKLNQEKNSFLGIAAHDLKNPITAIKGFAKLIESSNTSLEKEELIDFAKEIRVTGESMFQIVADLLDINAIEEGKINIQAEHFDMNELVMSKVSTYEMGAREKGISLNIDYSDGPAATNSDMNKAGQVFDNLLSNAVKFSEFNKNIFVSVKRISDADGDFTRVSVKDEGPGLNEEDMKKLFGKFAKLSAQPTNEESSTGLGLSIVKKLVEAMGGRIWCESEPGKGADFIFKLPAVSNAED